MVGTAALQDNERFPLTYESDEIVTGRVRQSDEWIEYRGTLKVEESGEPRVSLDLVFVPPHPFIVNMPDQYSIHAQSVTEAYSKLVRFLDEYGVELDC